MFSKGGNIGGLNQTRFVSAAAWSDVTAGPRNHQPLKQFARRCYRQRSTEPANKSQNIAGSGRRRLPPAWISLETDGGSKGRWDVWMRQRCRVAGRSFILLPKCSRPAVSKRTVQLGSVNQRFVFRIAQCCKSPPSELPLLTFPLLAIKILSSCLQFPSHLCRCRISFRSRITK